MQLHVGARGPGSDVIERNVNYRLTPKTAPLKLSAQLCQINRFKKNSLTNGKRTKCPTKHQQEVLIGSH